MFLLRGLFPEVHNQILGERMPATDVDLALHVAAVIDAAHDERGTTIPSVCVQAITHTRVPLYRHISTFNCTIDECIALLDQHTVHHGIYSAMVIISIPFFSPAAHTLLFFGGEHGGRVGLFWGVGLRRRERHQTTLPRTMRYC